MKRKIFLLAFFFLALTLFHKAILGNVARFILHLQYDCELAYRSVDWEGKRLVFSDLVLFDPSFHTHIEKVSVSFDWKEFPKKLKGHLEIYRPHVSVLKRRSLPALQKGWLDFKVSIEEGVVEWDGWAHFSLLDNRFEIDWGHSSAAVSWTEEEVEAELKHCKATLLNPYLPVGEILGGYFTGRAHVGADQHLLSAHLKVNEAAWSLGAGVIRRGEGTLSFNADLGAKWELQGEATAQEKTFPLRCVGKGFFKSDWIETEIELGTAFCQLSGGEIWKVICKKLEAPQATWLQPYVAFLFPECSSIELLRGTIDGSASFAKDFWMAKFQMEDLSVSQGDTEFLCQSIQGDLSRDGGTLVLADAKFDLKMEGSWKDWSAQARLWDSHLTLRGGWDGEKCPIVIQSGQRESFSFWGTGWVDPKLDFCLNLRGELDFAERKIPFHCPFLQKKGEDWTFDFRLERQTWNLARLVGTSDGTQICFHEKSHLLGAPLHFSPSTLDAFEVHFRLTPSSILAAAPFVKDWGLDVAKLPFLEEVGVQWRYREGLSSFVARGEAPFFEWEAVQTEEQWNFHLQSDLNLEGSLDNEGAVRGKAAWKQEMAVAFEGSVTPSFHCEMALSQIDCDLSRLPFLPMEGRVHGQGHLVYNGVLESDFDLSVSQLKIHEEPLENEGKIHLYYSSEKGALLRGVHLHGPYDCIVNLLEYDAKSTHWIFHDAQVHLPCSLLKHRLLQGLDRRYDLNFTADLDFASDFSTLACTMREGVIPIRGALHHVEDFHLSWSQGECQGSLRYLDHFHQFRFHVGENIAGRVILGEEVTPLTIDWEYADFLTVHAMTGSFGGIEASFHAESPGCLIGSARVDFATLSELLPVEVARGFSEIKMGRGYEFKGRLRIEKNVPSFQGILSGKQIEFFGFQFRTLLAQIELSPEKISIYDVKISDSAGSLKVEHILIENRHPWWIEIPTLTIVDLRPSLLQRPNEEVGPLSPLVVRELKLTDFQGELAEGKTYTAEGKLHFINSYKREESVFELPANVLSRIVGLDLELLIPVCGDLNFQLKDGFFNLTELSHAFSEAKRSEFFLEMDPPPSMDLDGNLKIFIKMKQHVLLKITESFLISIDGQLDDPQFHLKKKSFFGFL